MSTQLADQHLLYKAESDSPAEISVSTQKSIVVVPDNNQGSYSGQITFDAQSQLTGNNSKFASLEDTTLVIPYTATMRVSGNLPASAKAFNRFSLCPKFNVASIIDSISVELNNKSILTEQTFKQYWANVRAWTETTQDTVRKHGVDKMLYLDDWYSIQHTKATAGSYGGDGYSNNSINFVPSSAAAPSAQMDTGEGNNQEPYAFNSGFFNRLVNHAPYVIDSAENQSVFSWPSQGGKAAKNIAEQTGKSCFKEYAAPASGAGVANTIVGSWFWLHKIKLTDLHPLFEKLPLTANCQLKIKLRINQGKFAVLGNAAGGYTISSSIMTSGTTCPLMLPSMYDSNPLEGRITNNTVLEVAYGAMRNEFSNPAIEGSGYFPFNQSRLYIPMYEIENPTSLISSPTRTVSYLDCYAQMWNKQAGLGVKADGTQHNTPFNLQASGTHKNVKYVCLLPFAETSADNYLSVNGLPQYQSPCDSAPATLQPGSCIRNFQVEIGGTSVFNSVKEYDFSSFRDEIQKLSAINGGLGRFNCGLLNENQWAFANRMLVADVSRLSHKDVPASVVVSGVNGSSQGSDLLLLIIYERELELDILTGEVLSFN